MALKYGFFNSSNGDRKYDAEDISSIFDGIIEDGVFATIGNIFAVTPGTGLQVLVDTGKAWFNHTWTVNSEIVPLSLGEPDITLDRYDAVILEINHSESVRANSLKVLKGNPASIPLKPSMTRNELVNQYPLAYVLVKHGASSISASEIEIMVGQGDCPFVRGPLEVVNIDEIFSKWESEFDAWFENVQSQLEGNVVTNLQRQIDERVKISDKASEEDATAGTSDEKWMTPVATMAALKSEGFDIGDIKCTVRSSLGDKWLLCNGTILPKGTPFSTLYDRLNYGWATYLKLVICTGSMGEYDTHLRYLEDRVATCYGGSNPSIEYVTGGFNNSSFRPHDIIKNSAGYWIIAGFIESGPNSGKLAASPASSLSQANKPVGTVPNSFARSVMGKVFIGASPTYIVMVRFGGTDMDVGYVNNEKASDLSQWKYYNINSGFDQYGYLKGLFVDGEIFIAYGGSLVYTNNPTSASNWKKASLTESGIIESIIKVGSKYYCSIQEKGVYELRIQTSPSLSVALGGKIVSCYNASLLPTENGFCILSAPSNYGRVLQMYHYDASGAQQASREILSVEYDNALCNVLKDSSNFYKVAMFGVVDKEGGSTHSVYKLASTYDFYGKVIPDITPNNAYAFIKKTN